MKKQDIVLKWLNKEFGVLTMVVEDSRIYYIDKERKPLFGYYQNLKNGIVYIDYNRIWVFFGSIFGLNYLQTLEILTIWLEETYNLRGVIPISKPGAWRNELEETYNLRGVIPLKFYYLMRCLVGGDL